jgi:hypothetical protein
MAPRRAAARGRGGGGGGGRPRARARGGGGGGGGGAFLGGARRCGVHHPLYVATWGPSAPSPAVR